MDHIERVVPADACTELILFVNGQKVTEPNPDPEWTLLWYLRNRLQLTGTKYGCGEGGCGACTVMLSQYLPQDDNVKHIAINACLTPLCSVYGLAITTVEGIGSTEKGLHPVQERIAKAHGSQCGFCTPGFVMSMYTLIRTKKTFDYKDIETCLQGNLCRCTGYRPIIEGYKTFMDAWQQQYSNVDMTNGCILGEDCCKNKKGNVNSSQHLFEKSKFKPYDPSQEPIFPPELKLNHAKFSEQYLMFKGREVIWIRPKNLTQLLEVKRISPASKIVGGNTEIGVEMKVKKLIYPILLCPNNVSELYQCKVTESSFLIGAMTSLSDVKKFMENEIKKDTENNKVCKEIVEMLHWFAGTQVRNVASLAGNVITASPISDLNPILMASNSILHLRSSSKSRTLRIDQSFFKAYRTTSVNPDEIVIGIEIPFSKPNQYFKAYKQARRKDDDISIVTAAFNVTLEDKKILEANLCFGGLGPTTVAASNSSAVMKGKMWDENIINIVFEGLIKEFKLSSSTPGGMVEYRKSLCLSMFFKFYHTVLDDVNKVSESNSNLLNRMSIDYEVEPKSSQYFDIKGCEKHETDSVGQPIPHSSALKQATGEAVYCDDVPHTQREVYLSLIFSSRSHAKIISIDASKALAMPGVVAFLSASDIEAEHNKLGPIFKDEEIFSIDTVTSQACAIGAILAEDEALCRKAKRAVIIEYEDIEPTIITLEDAIKHESYFDGSPRVLSKGDVKQSFLDSEHVIEGYSRSGAQEHFYLEPFCAFAKRQEDELEIISSTQAPAEMAALVSHALNIPNHKVIVKTKRIGGGFGGKETRSAILTVPVAIAAYKLKRPVRAVFERDEDMQVTGTRHPVLIKYKVGFNKNGKIIGASFDIYSNAGNSMDISCSMNERLVTHVDNSYYIPNIEVKGYLCKTNLPSNTAFRGFGGPQAMFATENMIRDVAQYLNKPYEEVVETNMYNEGQLTHFNQALSHCTIPRCWRECIELSNYWQRKKEIDDFNKTSRWKKKGLSIVPTKYGISFGTNFLMQAGALIMIYTDGSVLLSIGGIEMGQGLFTKMIQVASKALQIGIEKIHISEMSTDKVPNSSPTAASISSDLYGMAVLDACNKLNKRLQPIKDSHLNKKWEEWISIAYFDRVNLLANGFYAAPKILYDPKTNKGDIFEYFTYGAACSEVIIDCLTGEHNVLRTDIVMDLGESLNPAIDIGQVEGAFMQGYGLFTIEELVYSPSGGLLSRGPGAYKIPGISDIPKVFNVSLLKGAPNPRAVYSSKAVGEPPLFLASSVFFAIKEAIKSARKDAGESEDFHMNAPATCELIRMACDDRITKMVRPSIIVDGKPAWNIVV